MANNAYLGSFEYNATQEPGLKWLPNGKKNYELYYEHTIIGDFLVARYGQGSMDKHIHPIDDRLTHIPPFPPLAEAHRRAKDRGLIK